MPSYGYIIDFLSLHSFIAYRALPHLNLKHTIFGHIIDDPTPSSTTLNNLELHPVNPSTNRPTPDIRIKEVTVFVDPFEEFLKEKQTQQAIDKGEVERPTDEEEQDSRREEDDRITWTGKRIRGAGETAADDSSGAGGVGKYLKATLAERANNPDEDEIVESVDEAPEPEPARKKVKGTGGFGDFSSW